MRIPYLYPDQVLNDKTMDHGIVALVRLATYEYAIENEDMEVLIHELMRELSHVPLRLAVCHCQRQL